MTTDDLEHDPAARRHRRACSRGSPRTRAIRRYTDEPVPPEALRAMLFAATRRRAARTASRSASSCSPTGPTHARPRRSIAEGARRAWGGKRVTDGYDEGSGARDDSPKARMARTMQRYVDEFEHVPVLVLPALVRYREPTPFEGASIYPGVPEPAARRPRPRLRRGAHRLALRGRGAAQGSCSACPRRSSSPPPSPSASPPATTARCVADRSRELVYGEAWEHAPDWAVDPPGTEHTAGRTPAPVDHARPDEESSMKFTRGFTGRGKADARPAAPARAVRHRPAVAGALGRGHAEDRPRRPGRSPSRASSSSRPRGRGTRCTRSRRRRTTATSTASPRGRSSAWSSRACRSTRCSRPPARPPTPRHVLAFSSTGYTPTCRSPT